MLEHLKGLTKINGENVIVMDELRTAYPERFTETGAMDHVWFETTIRPNSFIYVRNDKNSLAFTLQNGPIRENGKNGYQITEILGIAKYLLEQLNKETPSHENHTSIAFLQEAIKLQKRRPRN